MLNRMINFMLKNEKREGIKENLIIVEIHKRAAVHHETAAKLHYAAAKHQMAGNFDAASNCYAKAVNHGKLAKKGFKD